MHLPPPPPPPPPTTGQRQITHLTCLLHSSSSSTIKCQTMAAAHYVAANCCCTHRIHAQSFESSRSGCIQARETVQLGWCVPWPNFPPVYVCQSRDCGAAPQTTHTPRAWPGTFGLLAAASITAAASNGLDGLGVCLLRLAVVWWESLWARGLGG